jgi:hypothetical protein
MPETALVEWLLTRFTTQQRWFYYTQPENQLDENTLKEVLFYNAGYFCWNISPRYWALAAIRLRTTL